MRPSDSVGGDYLDFLSPEEFGGRGLCVVVDGISGHGPASALPTTAARAILRMRVAHSGSLSQIVGDLNRRLAADVKGTGWFMSFFLVQVDAGVLTWVRAGHEPALLMDPASGALQELFGDGMVLGIRPDEKFEEGCVPFSDSGCILALTTDGVTEATDAGDEMFGQDRLKQSLLKHVQRSAQGILEGVLADALAFCGDAPQNDDLTLAIVKRT